MTRLVVAGCGLLFFAGGLSTAVQAQNEASDADQYAELSGDFAASHILIAHRKAKGVRQDLARTKKEALAKAEDLLKQITDDPTRFEQIAREESEGASSALDGYLGGVSWGSMDGAFMKALRGLKVGEISREPVKTPFGYHIIRREPLRVKFYRAQILLLTYRGAVSMNGVPPSASGLYRAKEKSAALAESLAGSLDAGNFAQLVSQHGDYRYAEGILPPFKAGDFAFSADFVRIVDKLPYGGISPLVELPVGFLVLRRLKLEKLKATRILIRHIGADRVPATVIRTKEEASAFARQLLTEIQADPEKLASLAKKHSDGPNAKRGGTMPEWFAGTDDRDFERAVVGLKPGEILPNLLETEDGFVIVRRDPL